MANGNESFNVLGVQKAMESLEEYFTSFAETLADANGYIETIINVGEDSAVFGDYGSKLQSIWDQNYVTFDNFHKNFESWSEVVALISANNADFTVGAEAVYRDNAGTLDGIQGAKAAIVDSGGRMNVNMSSVDDDDVKTVLGFASEYKVEAGDDNTEIITRDDGSTLVYYKDKYGNLLYSEDTKYSDNKEEKEIIVKDKNGNVLYSKKNGKYYDKDGTTVITQEQAENIKKQSAFKVDYDSETGVTSYKNLDDESVYTFEKDTDGTEIYKDKDGNILYKHSIVMDKDYYVDASGKLITRDEALSKLDAAKLGKTLENSKETSQSDTSSATKTAETERNAKIVELEDRGFTLSQDGNNKYYFKADENDPNLILKYEVKADGSISDQQIYEYSVDGKTFTLNSNNYNRIKTYGGKFDEKTENVTFKIAGKTEIADKNGAIIEIQEKNGLTRTRSSGSDKFTYSYDGVSINSDSVDKIKDYVEQGYKLEQKNDTVYLTKPSSDNSKLVTQYEIKGDGTLDESYMYDDTKISSYSYLRIKNGWTFDKESNTVVFSNENKSTAYDALNNTKVKETVDGLTSNFKDNEIYSMSNGDFNIVKNNSGTYDYSSGDSSYTLDKTAIDYIHNNPSSNIHVLGDNKLTTCGAEVGDAIILSNESKEGIAKINGFDISKLTNPLDSTSSPNLGPNYLNDSVYTVADIAADGTYTLKDSAGTSYIAKEVIGISNPFVTSDTATSAQN